MSKTFKQTETPLNQMYVPEHIPLWLYFWWAADTNGPVATVSEKISPSFVGDGRTYKGFKVLHVHQCNGGQVLWLYWRWLLLQAMLPWSPQAISIPSDLPLDWLTLCTIIPSFPWIQIMPWSQWWHMFWDIGGAISYLYAIHLTEMYPGNSGSRGSGFGKGRKGQKAEL